MKVALKPIENEDDDVEKERQKVVGGEGSVTDALRLVNLTKVRQTLYNPIQPFSYPI